MNLKINIGKIVIVLLALTVFALLFAACLFKLARVALCVLFVASIVYVFLGALVFLMLRNIIRYGNYSTLPVVKRLLNFSVLLALCLSMWFASYYGILLLVFNPILVKLLLGLFPIQGMVGLLAYCLVLSHSRKYIAVDEKLDLMDQADSDEDEDEDEAKNNDNEEIISEAIDQIAIRVGSKVQIVPVVDIQYLQSDGDYVQIITSHEKYLKEQTMRYFEQNLPNHFVRVHRSYIVNALEISKIELYEKQNHHITLKNGTHLKISQTGYKSLRRYLNL